jgi:hypothetical protein
VSKTEQLRRAGRDRLQPNVAGRYRAVPEMAPAWPAELGAVSHSAFRLKRTFKRSRALSLKTGATTNAELWL